MRHDASNQARMAFILLLIGAACVLLPYRSASGATGLELQEVSIGYDQFFPGGSDPLVTQGPQAGKHLDKGIDLTINSNVYGYMYWNNLVHSKTDDDGTGHGQFRTVGWQFEYGVRLTDTLDVYYHHHSQHLLDESSTEHFPVEDAWGIRINLLKMNKQETLF